MHAFYDDLFGDDPLWEAWKQVRRNKGCVGFDGVSVADVDAAPAPYLRHIAAELDARAYEPDPVVRFFIPKTDGSARPLAVPTVRDRITLTALARGFAERFDGAFAESCFAYRPRRSMEQAAEVVRDRIAQGFRWTLHFDISSYFDSLDHRLLMERLAELTGDPDVLELVARFLVAPIADGQRLSQPEQGVVQGSPLSPFLSNLYLNPLDHYLEERGVAFIRYADNFLVQIASRRDAESVFALMDEALNVLRLRLHEGKSRVGDAETGFRFLGRRFRLQS